MITLSVFESILSDGEREKWRELRELAKMRLDVRTESLAEANRTLRDAEVNSARAKLAYEQALIEYAPDDDDDYVTEQEKAFKLEKAEEEFVAAGLAHRAALIRATWELKEASKIKLQGDEPQQ